MSMTVRYAGEFLSRKGVRWRCEILQESDVALPVGELTFPASEPLLIEWEEVPLESPVCSSKATLTVVSPSDRTYIDLYTIKPGQIRLDVYMYVGEQKNLYWSGCLDPEFYEEPYDRGTNYDVSLTFSDYGILKRIPYDLSGKNTLFWVISSALQRSGIKGAGISQDYISSVINGSSYILNYIQIASENFFDEDGEALDYYKVLEGILQPLGLRIIQRYGGNYVYDINGLRSKAKTKRKIEWNGTGQQLGVGRVVNNIKVTFSPYSSAELQSGDLTYEEEFGPEWTNLTSEEYGNTKYNGGAVPSSKTAPECYSYYIDYDEAHKSNGLWDYNLISFTIFRAPYGTKKCKGLAEIGSYNRYFKIFPNLGGQECEGVARGFYTGGHGGLTTGWPKLKGTGALSHDQTLAFRTTKSYLPTLSSDDAANYYIRIREEILVDPRYNPFEQSGDGNEGGNYDTFKSYASHAFVPVAITVYSENGNALYHYTNKTLTQNGHPDDSVRATLGSWTAGVASFGDAWLAYYNVDDLLKDTGLGGWSPNHHNFGKPWTTGKREKKRKWHYMDGYGNTKDFYQFDSMKKIPDGQYIPYPPAGGYLEIVVYNGVYILDDTEKFTTDYANTLYKDKYGKIRWQLYKLPEVSVVKRTLTLDKAEVDDIEYSGVVNVDAKESLDIDTICGTTPEVCPTAKGVFLNTDGLPLNTLTRAGRTDCPEHLFIGTLYSQFAERRTALSGQVALDIGMLCLYYDEAQASDAVFMKTGEEQDLIDDSAESIFLEIRPDEYEGEE